jgi:transcriptional regulator with XRE-family HTH domain
MYPPGLRLRQARERLGLTYREVEKASVEIAIKRGRSDFILHISRLADIENRNVVPSLYKLYSVSVIYHLSVAEISGWYEAPFPETFQDGTNFPSPRTHLSEFLSPLEKPLLQPDVHKPQATDLLNALPPAIGGVPGGETAAIGRYRYGYIGLSDRRMIPILRPGSIVLIDTTICNMEEADWNNEYDRPIYFVELREGYRCGWFHKTRTHLDMQPHPLSHCAPESWRIPEDAEVVGKVVGVATYLNEPWNCAEPPIRVMRVNLNRTTL